MRLTTEGLLSAIRATAIDGRVSVPLATFEYLVRSGDATCAALELTVRTLESIAPFARRLPDSVAADVVTALQGAVTALQSRHGDTPKVVS